MKKPPKSQSVFECCSCGHITNADHNAALNISQRAAVDRPIVGGVDGKAALLPNCAGANLQCSAF